jgi:hypothetical protein
MNKFGAIKTEVDGITFASKKEARRYSELKLLERAGQIRNLELQRRFPLKIGNRLICTYVSDFVYCTNPKPGAKNVGEFIVEDAKGMKTPVYKLKAKLFEALHGFPITEV